MLDLSPRALVAALIIWIVPLAVSFGLYNPQTDVYIPNYWGFKLIMAALGGVTAWFCYRWLARSQPLTIGVPNTVIAVNAVLDLLLLVMTFGMPLSNWALTILPIYLVVYYGIWWWLARRA